MQFISSTQNPVFKQALKLDKKRNRESSNQFLVEGIREIQLALRADYVVDALIFNEKASVDQNVLAQFKDLECHKHIFSKELFSKLAYRDRVSNVLALVQIPQNDIDRFFKQSPKLIVILESIEKPGNLGAIFRTCDAAGVDAVIIAEPKTDIYHPNVVRASLGSLFTTPFFVMSNQTAHAHLKSNRFTVYTTWLQASKPHFHAAMKGKTALVVGSEAQGVTDFWIENSDDNIIIPMRGEVDSMNVSTACAVVIFEAIRQQSHSD